MRRFTAVLKLLLLWQLRLQATCTALKMQLGLHLPLLTLSLSLSFALSPLFFSYSPFSLVPCLSLLGAANVPSVASEMRCVALGKGSLSRI